MHHVSQIRQVRQVRLIASDWCWLHGHWRFDGGVVLVVAHFKVFKCVAKQVLRLAAYVQRGVGVGLARELLFYLAGVVAVDMAVAPSPDKVAHLQAALLRHHVCKQRVAGNIEWYAQKNIGAALVKLATELARFACLLRRRNVKLEKGMARHERHLV